MAVLWLAWFQMLLVSGLPESKALRLGRVLGGPDDILCN